MLIKHSGADGSELWRRSLPGASDGEIYLPQDAEGDILVAIYLYGTRNSVLLKISPDGSELWRVDLPGVQLFAAVDPSEVPGAAV